MSTGQLSRRLTLFIISIAAMTLAGVWLYAQQRRTETTITITDRAMMQHLPEAGHVTLVRSPVHVDADSRKVRTFIIVSNSEGSSNYGLSLKSIGYLSKTPGGLGEVHAPIANVSGLIRVRLLAEGRVWDTDTDGATASCITFKLAHDKVAEIPYEVIGRTKAITQIAYEVEVRSGDQVKCLPSGTLDDSGQLYLVDRIFFSAGMIR